MIRSRTLRRSRTRTLATALECRRLLVPASTPSGGGDAKAGMSARDGGDIDRMVIIRRKDVQRAAEPFES